MTKPNLPSVIRDGVNVGSIASLRLSFPLHFDSPAIREFSNQRLHQLNRPSKHNSSSTPSSIKSIKQSKFHLMFLIDKARKQFAVASEPIPIDNDGGGSASLTPLSDIAEAFEELALLVEPPESGDLQLSSFCEACSHVSVLFGCLGLAFKFAELEYVSKVRNLNEASSRFTTLHDILDLDVENDTVKVQGSYSRNLRRVRQGLDLIRALFEQFLTSDDYCLKEAASTAYAEVCAPYHTWAVRTAVSAGMYALPTREQLLIKLNETEKSAEKKMRRYIEASIPVINYIDKLYISRNIILDW